MKKKILCLAMTLIMVVGASMTAQAQDYQGQDGWVVDFDGDNMNSNFSSQDMSDSAANIQPGDSIELKVEVKNSFDGDTDWYMTNEVIQSLEDAKAQASGGAYDYLLTYYDPSNNESVLYDSTVGGEGATDAEGLHQATQATEDYLYLGRLTKGQSGSVHLKVTVDGETQGNNYQQTLASLQLNFAVEKVVAGTTTTNTVTNTVNSGNSTVVNSVLTGDNNRLLLFSAIALVSGIVLLVLGIYTMKRRKDSREGE